MADKRDSEQIMEDVFGTPGETSQDGAGAADSRSDELAEAARDYAQNRLNRLAIEAEAKAIKKLEKEAEARFLQLCADTGVDGIRVTVEDTVEVGGKKKKIDVRYTLSPKRDRYLQLVGEETDSDAVIAALKRSGKYAYLVQDSYSTSSLVALLREFENEGRELPPTLAEVVKLGERYSVSMVKSSKG